MVSIKTCVNTLMDFRRFLEEDECNFTVSGISVNIREVPMASHERVMLEGADQALLTFIRDRVGRFAREAGRFALAREAPDVVSAPEDNLRKFRVTLRYPRSRKGSKLGHYLKDVMYVYAKSAADAKKRAEHHVRTRMEPVENDETRRWPKLNYLKGTRKKHLDLQANKVNNWDDLANMLRHVTTARNELTPLDYLDEDDLKIVLKEAKKKDFAKVLSRLRPAEQRLLKRFYFHMAQSPYLDQETKALLGGELGKTMRMLGGKKIPHERAPGEDEAGAGEAPRGEWDYWSVFEPESEEEESRLLQGVGSVKDVFEAGRRYGIEPSKLRQVKDDLFKSEGEYIDSQRRLWKYLRKHLKVSPNNKLFASDYNDPQWAKKYGVHWDELADHLLRSREDYADAVPFSGDDDAKTNDDVANFVWDFYQRGMPKKRPPLEQWKRALEHVLEYRRRVLSGERGEDVPF